MHNCYVLTIFPLEICSEASGLVVAGCLHNIGVKRCIEKQLKPISLYTPLQCFLNFKFPSVICKHTLPVPRQSHFLGMGQGGTL